jgi:hypothetical protein
MAVHLSGWMVAVVGERSAGVGHRAAGASGRPRGAILAGPRSLRTGGGSTFSQAADDLGLGAISVRREGLRSRIPSTRSVVVSAGRLSRERA